MKNVAAPLVKLEREAYEANSLSRQKPREAMGMSRAKWYRLGKPSPQQNSETSPSITNGEASGSLPFRRPGVKPFRWLFQSE